MHTKPPQAGSAICGVAPQTWLSISSTEPILFLRPAIAGWPFLIEPGAPATDTRRGAGAGAAAADAADNLGAADDTCEPMGCIARASAAAASIEASEPMI